MLANFDLLGVAGCGKKKKKRKKKREKEKKKEDFLNVYCAEFTYPF